MKDIAIYGAGGFGREVACLIEFINRSESGRQWNFVGFFDDSLDKGTNTSYGTVLGCLDDLNNWSSELSLVICIGKKDVVRRIAEQIDNPYINYPNIISPDIIILDKESVNLGVGNIICSRCLMTVNINIGDFNILNGFIGIGHDVMMGSYNTIMPGVKISGAVNIGDNNYIGLDAGIIQNIKIGNDVTIGAKSLVIRNTVDGNHYFGNPAVKFVI